MYSNYNLWDPWVPDELLPQGSNLHSETDADSCSTEHRPAGCRIKSFLETRETGSACCKDVYWTPAHTDTELTVFSLLLRGVDSSRYTDL